jgi:acylphosphatase
MSTDRQRLRIYYSGRVQGVGFRYTVKNLAPGYEVTGTVRNLADGRVELVAEGARAELEAFRQAVRDSGLGSLIEREQSAWEEAAGGMRGFEIAF